jgi:hypothetical protein
MAAKNNDRSTDSAARIDDAGPAPSLGSNSYATGNAARPLSLLAERLGELEQSLTVVASELGVSGTPQFKHLDTQKVYAEAANHARQAVQQSQSELLSRMQEVGAASAALGVRVTSELAALVSRIDDLDIRLATLLQQLEATRRKIEHQSSLAPAIAALRDRLDKGATLTPAPAQPDHAQIEVLRQRLDALERRQHSAAAPAEWPFAEDGSPVQKTADAAKVDIFAVQRDIEEALQNRLNHTMRELEARMLQRLEERLDAIPSAASAVPDNTIFDQPASVPANDIDGLREMIAAELASLLPQHAASVGPVPLPGESLDLNPLVIGATERAIVRLTHRIEKLEGRTNPNDSQRPAMRTSTRPSRKFMSRLFET